MTLEYTNVQPHGIIFLYPILGLNVYNVVIFLVDRTNTKSTCREKDLLITISVHSVQENFWRTKNTKRMLLMNITGSGSTNVAIVKKHLTRKKSWNTTLLSILKLVLRQCLCHHYPNPQVSNNDSYITFHTPPVRRDLVKMSTRNSWKFVGKFWFQKCNH